MSIKWFWVLFFGLLMLPYLIASPLSFSPYEPIKVWFTILWSLILGLLSFSHPQGMIKKNIVYTVLLLITWLVVTSIINRTIGHSLIGNAYRHDGLLAQTALMLIALSVASAWKREYLEGLVWNARINSILVPTVIMLFPQMNWLFGNPVITSGYIIMLTPFLFVKTRENESNAWLFTGLITIGITVITARAWGALLCLLILGIIKLPLTKMYKAAALLLLSMAVFVGYVAETKERGFTSESRQRIYMKGLIAIKEKPLLGWGWSNFSTAFTQIDYPEYFKIDAYVDRAHLSVIEYAVAGGVPALLLYLYLVYQALSNLKTKNSHESRLWLLVAVIYLIHSQTNVTSIAEDLFFWITVGRAIQA